MRKEDIFVGTHWHYTHYYIIAGTLLAICNLQRLNDLFDKEPDACVIINMK